MDQNIIRWKYGLLLPLKLKMEQFFDNLAESFFRYINSTDCKGYYHE